MKRRIKFLSLISCAGLLGACGGGGGGGASTAPVTASPILTPTQGAEGLWSGTRTSTTTTQQIAAYSLISSNGNYFVVYHSAGNYDSVAAGTSVALSTAISSADYASYSLVVGGLSYNGSFAGTLQTKSTLAATITYSSGTPKPDPDILSLVYDSQYDTPSALTAVAGNYTYSANSTNPTYTFTVGASNGAISGSISNGCQFTGQMSIRSSSKNMYDLVLTVTNCPTFTLLPLSGLATYVTLPGESVKTLILVALKNDAGQPNLFFAAGKH